MNTRVLVVEDDENIAELIRYNLESNGYNVDQEFDGEDAMFAATENIPDIILLDWMLPSISGIEICRRLRRHANTKNIPIIMLTARTEEADRVRGLDTGADDYLTKPFSPKELIARIKAVMRRIRPALAAEELVFEDIKMDNASHKVTRGDKHIRLGPTEYKLLRHFLQNIGRVYSREQLLDRVWGQDTEVELRTVDVHIRRLRKSLDVDGLADYIRTVRAAGYSMDKLTS